MAASTWHCFYAWEGQVLSTLPWEVGSSLLGQFCLEATRGSLLMTGTILDRI